MDIISGSTSLASLRSLIKVGVKCRCFSEGPRLHAKVYLFGKECAVVTSANLTRNALDNNIEVGVQLTGKSVHELIDWFNHFWNMAEKFNLSELAKWEQETGELCLKYKQLRVKVSKKKALPKESLPSVRSRKDLRSVMENATRFFVCNTNRRWSSEAEKSMFERGYAAVWEDFRYRSHIARVEPNDVVLMFAKGVGIIGIGRAKYECKILKVSDRNRILSTNEIDTPEWRIPVDWLAWVEDDADACPCTIPNVSFVDVSGQNYKQLREAVSKHFLRS